MKLFSGSCPCICIQGLQTAPGDGDELEPGEDHEAVAELGFDNQILNLVLEAGAASPPQDLGTHCTG